MNYKNFYENTKEARMRLLHTIVLYDGEPQYIIAITDHKNDGIFRAYSIPIGEGIHKLRIPDICAQLPPDNPQLGPRLDERMKQEEKCNIQRKHLSSPLFNKFRPFPLGMCNVREHCYYVERIPNRKTEQGLIKSMLVEQKVSISKKIGLTFGQGDIDIFGKELYRTIKGEYPDIERCVREIKDPGTINEAVGFHRKFALIRGPINMIFLGYKGDVIGVLPNNDLSLLKLGREYLHCREVVEELKLFDSITY